MKHLIMGFGTNQTRDSVEVFLRSARNVLSPEEADIVLVTNSRAGLEDILEDTESRAINTPNTYSNSTSKFSKLLNRGFLHSARIARATGMLKTAPEISEGYMNMLEIWHHPQLARWFAYRRILNFVGGYDGVFLGDVKDVVFQSSPFETIVPGHVSLFEDGEDFRTGEWNQKWYRSAYGDRAYENVSHRQPICIGTVLGEFDVVRGMVVEFAQFLSRSPFGKIEQAVFNHMYFNDMFDTPVQAVANFDDAVATLAGDQIQQECSLDDDNQIVRLSDERAFPVVHMYNRFPEFDAAVKARFVKD